MLTLGWCRRYGHSACHQKDASDDGEPGQGPSHEDRCRHHRWKVGQLDIHHTGGRLRQTGLGFSAFYPVPYLGQVSMLGFSTFTLFRTLDRSLYWDSVQFTLYRALDMSLYWVQYILPCSVPWTGLHTGVQYIYPVPYLGQVFILGFSTLYPVPYLVKNISCLYSLFSLLTSQNHYNRLICNVFLLVKIRLFYAL